MAGPEIDIDLCIGCGLCVEICPDVFELSLRVYKKIVPAVIEISEKTAVVKDHNACGKDDCLLAAETCPVSAISFS